MKDDMTCPLFGWIENGSDVKNCYFFPVFYHAVFECCIYQENETITIISIYL
jgi:hypothetical protein